MRTKTLKERTGLSGIDWFSAALALAALGVLALSPLIFILPARAVLESSGATLPALALAMLRWPWIPTLASAPLWALFLIGCVGAGGLSADRRRLLIWQALLIAPLVLAMTVIPVLMSVRDLLAR